MHHFATTSIVLLATLLPFFSLISMATSHGMMCTSRQRGAYSSLKCRSTLEVPHAVVDYCAHSFNGGTVADIKANLPPNGWKEYEPTIDFYCTADRAGICGDRKGEVNHLIGEIDTNHNGYFEFFLCNLDACGKIDMDASCFVNNHCVKLHRVPHKELKNPSEATIHECGPIDIHYPGRWYVPCRNTGHVGVHIVGGESGTMRYQLPADVACQHCVLQWYWATANTCAPKGFKDYFVSYNSPFGTTCDSDGGARGTYRSDMAECGGNLVPAEFWTCTDVQIS